MCGLSWWVPTSREPETIGSDPTTTRISARSLPLIQSFAPDFTWPASLNSENPAAFASRMTSRVDVSAVRATAR